MKTDIFKKLAASAKKYKYMLIVIAAGVLLLLLPNGSGDKSASPDPAPEYESFDLAALQRQISDALSEIDGVGKTEVVLTLSSTMETVYQTDSRGDENETSLSYQTETVITNAGSGVQSAVVRERVYPKFRGALIVCEGASSASVRLEVTRAVEALTGLSSDRITVLKRGTDH